MEKMKQWLRRWLGIEQTAQVCAAQVLEAWAKQQFSPALEETRARIEDLEAAYPDYKKAKAEADEKRANEIIPGFVPFSAER